MTEHLTECGLYLFRYLRQLQVEACYEGAFPVEVGPCLASGSLACFLAYGRAGA